MNYLKSSHEAVAAEALTSLGGFTPPAVLALGARVASKAPQRSYNTVTTNVPGPQQPLFVLGRQMLKGVPLCAARGQVRLGVAIFSYNGKSTSASPVTTTRHLTSTCSVMGSRTR